MAALGGVVLAFTNSIVDFGQFDRFVSITYVGWAFVGGIGYRMCPLIGSLVVYIIAVYLGPETKGMVMTADLEVIEAEVTLG